MMDFSQVIDLFNKMDYDSETITDEATPRSLARILSSNKDRTYDREKLRNFIFGTRTNMTNIEKALFINNLADKFEEERDILIHLESKFRYFNKKDADESVRQFIANLRYNSGHVYKSSAENISVGIIIEDHSPLPYLGSILGSTLAAGNRIVFNPEGKKILAVIFFIEHTMKALGFPDNNVHIYYGQDFDEYGYGDKILLYSCGHNRAISLYINMLLQYSDGKIPMLVFNSADLESASYSAIQAVWGFQGVMPWCVNTILVQEDVFADFVALLKEKLLKVRIPGDISKPRLCKTYVDQYKSLVSEATRRNVDFWTSRENGEFSPLIVIGEVLIENGVIEEEPKYSIPFATILPFRSAGEAVALANNSRQGLAASVWAENVGLINEVARKLQVGTVWINAHGKFRPDVSFLHQKSGYGYGYMNGVEGALQNESIINKLSIYKSLLPEKINITETLSKMKISQGKWSKQSAHARMLQLRKVGLIIANNKNDFISKTGLDTNELDEWIRVLTEEKPTCNNSTCDETSDIKSYREPTGSIALIHEGEDFKKFATSAIADGNSLILFTRETTGFSKMVKEIEKYFPGIIKSVDGNPDCNHLPSKYIDRICYTYVSWYDDPRISLCPQSLDDYRLLTTKLKNIWYDFGDSFS